MKFLSDKYRKMNSKAIPDETGLPFVRRGNYPMEKSETKVNEQYMLTKATIQ